MQDNFIQKISPTIRILILLIILLILFMAKSIYLILFITTFTLVLFLITGKSVNEYVNVLKRTLFLLLIFLFTYIIVCGEYQFLNIVRFIYKLIILDIIFSVFKFNSNFKSIHQGLYGILLPLKKFKIDVEKLSYDLTLTFNFIEIILFESESLKNKVDFYGIKRASIKKLSIIGFIYSINKFNKFQQLLEMEFYNVNYERPNSKSKIVLCIFIILLVGCVFKEVIL